MTEDQRADLQKRNWAITGGPIEVLHLDNITLPARGTEGARALLDLAREHQSTVIAAVLPAHVAAAWVMQEYTLEVMLYLPVSVPAAAKEGEVRGGGFTFSHWERY
jgi:hypothetical protein